MKSALIKTMRPNLIPKRSSFVTLNKGKDDARNVEYVNILGSTAIVINGRTMILFLKVEYGSIFVPYLSFEHSPR